jgi:putative transposase
MSDSKEVFEPDCFYHVFNKSVGDELLFRKDENYLYFLSLIKKHLDPFVNFYAYCLMPNHFHFLIQIKDENSFEDQSNKEISRLISHKFGNVFNTYAQAYNKENDRKGSLFKNRFKRKKISEQKYLLELILYIHLNPVDAGLCENIEECFCSSYGAILSISNTIIKRNEVIEIFGNVENFIFVHDQKLCTA